MNNSRIIGNNITLELQNRSIDYETFKEKLGYAEGDLWKLLEGRIFVPPFQLDRIADILQVTRQELMKDRGVEAYNKLIHNFRRFKNSENQELILDLIDMYADLEETLAE